MKNLLKSLALVGVLIVVGDSRTQATGWPLNVKATPNPMCYNSGFILSVDNWGTVNYNWYLNGTYFGTTTSPSVWIPNNYVTASYGCCAVLYGTAYCDSVDVVVNPTSVGGTATADASAVCSGGSTTIRLTGNTGAIQWYQSSDCASWVAISGANSATYTTPGLTATTCYGATSTSGACPYAISSFATVTVFPLPATPTASNDGAVCTGGTVALHASTVSGATHYHWYRASPEWTYLGDAQNLNVPNAQPGWTGAFYCYTTTESCWCAAPGSTYVTVNPYPAAGTATAAASTVCSGGGTTISISGNTPNTAYYWYSSPDDASWAYTGTANGPLTTGPLTASTYFLCVSYNGSCGVWSSTHPLVTVNAIPAAPTAGNNGPVCPGSTLSLTAATVSGATYAWTGPASFTSALQNPTRPSATAAMTGTYSVTVTVAGCTSAAGTTSVTVNDTQLPTITCPANRTVDADSGLCYATGVALGPPVTSDNCGILTATNNAPAQYPKGVTTVTWTAVDLSGNLKTCTQTVTVNDTQPPTITCPADVTVSVGASCMATSVVLGTPVTGDNCSVASVVSNAPAAYPLGTNVVTWKVTDGSGNTRTCTQKVIVRDTTAPTIISYPADVDITL